MTTAIVLYYGDNGQHEFYESETRNRKRGMADLIIIRHHKPDAQWFVLESAIVNRDRIPAGPLTSVIRAVTERSGQTVEVSPHRQWKDRPPRFPSDKMNGMALVDVEPSNVTA